ncbi:MAG: Ig-like domain-containing protein, partial [Clostridia bacterium]|nr:Ig-like domain-containing protein [Clostridia bacterium]
MKFIDFMKKRWYLTLIAVVLIAVGVFAAVTLLGHHGDETVSEEEPTETAEVPKERVRLIMTALKADRVGVNTESGFMLNVPKGTKLDEKVIREGLKITPSIDYSIEKPKNGGLVIKPKRFLQPNTVYTFKLDLPNQNIKESWAFQTRREFKIVSTIPGNKGTAVPLNSGIEITFSHTDIENFEENFSIEPPVKGRFEIHKNVGVFVPEGLTKDTIYTVTVKKGVSHGGTRETLKEDYTFSFQTETPSAGQNTETYLNFYDSLYNFPTDVQPVIEVGASSDFKDQIIELALYRYESSEAFEKAIDAMNAEPGWAVVEKERYKPDVSALPLFKSYTIPLTWVEESYYISYLDLPENLPEGHYVLFMKSNGKEDFSFIQINDTQLYVTMTENAALVWANDMITGQPVANAVFEGGTLTPVTTKEDGTAKIEQGLYKGEDSRTICFKLTREGHPPLIAPIYTSGTYNSGVAQADYKSNWRYIYLDRSTYLPTDTVKVWGVLKPRSGETPPKSLTLNLKKDLYDFTTYESSVQVLETKEIQVSGRGVFQAEFAFKDLPQGYYGIELKSGDTVVESNGFSVNKYIKNEYVMSVKPEYNAYFQGETVKADIGCEFYEGTPVSGFEADYAVTNTDNYGVTHEGSVTLDDQGHAALDLKLADDKGPASWEPQSYRINVCLLYTS